MSLLWARGCLDITDMHCSVVADFAGCELIDSVLEVDFLLKLKADVNACEEGTGHIDTRNPNEEC